MEEGFQKDESHSEYMSYMGSFVQPPTRNVISRKYLSSDIKQKYDRQSYWRVGTNPNYDDILLLPIAD